MKHEKWAAKQGRTLTMIQGRFELWEDNNGGLWLYHLDKKKWFKTEMVPA